MTYGPPPANDDSADDIAFRLEGMLSVQRGHLDALRRHARRLILLHSLVVAVSLFIAFVMVVIASEPGASQWLLRIGAGVNLLTAAYSGRTGARSVLETWAERDHVRASLAELEAHSLAFAEARGNP